MDFDQQTQYIFDIRDTLRILRENTYIDLDNCHIEDILYFIHENLELNIGNTLEVMSSWGIDENITSSNFSRFNEASRAVIRELIGMVTCELWLKYKSMNMFDINNTGFSSFPFILKGILGTSIILLKDDVISTNIVNVYVKST